MTGLHSGDTDARPAFLDDRGLQLLLFGGKGGVGKTTCAAAAGLRRAQRFSDSSFLLVSTDPAHSLADSLAGLHPPVNLTVLELDAQACLSRFKAEHSEKLREIASRGTFLDDEDLRRLLDLSLPGLDEIMAFLEIAGWVRDRTYDCILVDTAPTGHTLRLLETPKLLRQWLGALDAMLGKHRYMRRVFMRSSDRDQLDIFLEELAASVESIEVLLRDPQRCRFVPVTIAETLSVRETLSLVRELRRQHMPVGEIVVNRIYPKNLCPACTEGRKAQMRELAKLFRNPGVSRCALWGIPLYAVEVRGEFALRSFCSDITRLSEPTTDRQFSSPPPPQVEARVAPPSPDATLLLFGGKGGVGKTTLACATALWLAQECPQKRVLLFSTDPAHSLADCLDVPVGPRPTVVFPCLSALEIDPQAELWALKQQYAADLAQFLAGIGDNVDPTFDRRVMEKLLDLAPPGLDEITALSKVLDLLSQKSYDVFVLDSAATGHLIRWLELPALIDEWLKVFFGLFLKYRQVLRLTRFADRLIELSRNLKALEKLLHDPSSAQVIAVSVLTEMALEETKDLVAACERTSMFVPAIFLNLVTPASECSVCSALRRQEEWIRHKFQQVFPGKQLPLIYRKGELRGVPRLLELGQAMYMAVGKESPSYVC